MCHHAELVSFRNPTRIALTWWQFLDQKFNLTFLFVSPWGAESRSLAHTRLIASIYKDKYENQICLRSSFYSSENKEWIRGNCISSGFDEQNQMFLLGHLNTSKSGQKRIKCLLKHLLPDCLSSNFFSWSDSHWETQA